MIMENLVPPMVETMWPSLRESGQFETAVEADAGIDWISAEEIGRVCGRRLHRTRAFPGHEIDLAAGTFALPEVAAKITKGDRVS
jgi:hypothetical protein